MDSMNRKQRRQAERATRRALRAAQVTQGGSETAEQERRSAGTPPQGGSSRRRRRVHEDVERYAYLTGEDIAEFLGVHKKTVERWRKKYRLPCMRLGGRIRYSVGDVTRWASARKEGA